MAKARAGTKGRKNTSGGTGAQKSSRTQKSDSQQDEDFGENLVQRRHQDWIEHNVEWRQLLDSHEGGSRYRNAVYGPDRKGMPARNLFRHRREYPDPQQFPNQYDGWSGFSAGGMNVGSGNPGYGPWPGDLGADPAATAADDDYELRRSRTTVPPNFVREAYDIHTGKIFDQGISRDGPDCLLEWWKDVDGCGTPMDDYMKETIALLLLVLGNIDVCLDHPKLPEGVEVATTRFDEERLGLGACVASYILPENMVWWRNDTAGRYTECLVREYVDPSDRKDLDDNGNPIDTDDESEDNEDATLWRNNYVRWRHWTSTESTLWKYDGKEMIGKPIKHNFGRVPIVRLFDIKKPRTRNVGLSRYAPSAELMRAFYNKDSELTMSDTLQAHPSLSGSKNFCKADQTVSFGPGNVLPIDVTPDGTVIPWEYVTPPKDPAESLRSNMQDIQDRSDRINGLTKPAGVQGTTGGSVGQSGISKQLDATSGNKILSAIAKTLAKAERILAEFAYLVLTGKEIDPKTAETLIVGYPTRFELQSADEILAGTTQLQQVMMSVGNAPNTERELIKATIRQLLPGIDDDGYKVIDDEIELLVEQKALIQENIRDMHVDASSKANAVGQGSTEQAAGEDDSGQSNATAIASMVPVVR